MFTFLKNLVSKRTEQDEINAYLSDSSDLADLENRIRQIDRNEAPWQVKANKNLAGWV